MPCAAARAYLSRFGFLYEDAPKSASGYGAGDPGDEALPIGFAIERGFVAPYANPPVDEPTDVVGLTCAACHTGRIDVKDGEIALTCTAREVPAEEERKALSAEAVDEDDGWENVDRADDDDDGGSDSDSGSGSDSDSDEDLDDDDDRDDGSLN